MAKDLGDGGPQREIIRLHKGEFFGERALLSTVGAYTRPLSSST